MNEWKMRLTWTDINIVINKLDMDVGFWVSTSAPKLIFFFPSKKFSKTECNLNKGMQLEYEFTVEEHVSCDSIGNNIWCEM